MILNFSYLNRGRSDAPSPIILPAYWGHYGDSQTAGRESEATAKNPRTIFKTMWDASYTPATYVDTSTSSGVSGRILNATVSYCLGRVANFGGTAWIHVQESGGQDSLDDSQETVEAFGTTFYDSWVSIAATYPGGLYSYETAHSFSPARKAQPYRNWDTYNTEMRAQVAALALVGITVHIVETEARIDSLIAELGYDTVCFPDTDPNAYHYQGIGNFMIALTMFDTFNYNVGSLVHSGINLNSSHKATAVAIFTG